MNGHHLPSRTVAWWLPLAVLFVSGCGDGGPQVKPLRVSLGNVAAAPAMVSSAPFRASPPALAPTVTSIEFTLGTFQLSESATCGADVAAEQGCNEIEVEAGDVTVNVPLDGMTTVFDGILVPTGDYSRLQAVLRGVVLHLGADPDYDSGAIAEDIDLVLDPPLNVTEGAASFEILITFDPTGWFDDGSGGELDPAVPEDAGMINENVKKSLNAGEIENS